MQIHVLLVEDEANIVEAMRFLLGREGWQVSAHADGATALAAIRSLSPDLVVLDVMLPGRSGFEILAEIRADPQLSATPVLVLTARGQAREREEATRAGANRFLAKPFANAELVAALRDLAQPLHAAASPEPLRAEAGDGRNGKPNDGLTDGTS